MKVCLAGSTGKMGKALEKCLKNHQIVGRIHSGSDLQAELSEAEIVIDFSNPLLIHKILDVAKIPVVTGTTGTTFDTLPPIPFLYSPNFSLGMALFEKMCAHIAHLETILTETHHKDKKDAPSGTALRLEKLFSKRPTIYSKREPLAVAEHRIDVPLTGETLSLEHRAHDRSVFALGAVRAAEWLYAKPPGRYNLSDIL